ncbi:MAG: LacI family DNA-binding transcriptional regulator [Candidatus Methanomethyliaceae archaeon]
MAERPTIRDVARLAQVSPTTVSRVLNGKDAEHMRPETKQRVLRALAELDYVPVKAARTLRRNAAGIIAVLLPDVSNPFFACLARGVEAVSFQNGVPMMICDSNHSYEKEARYLDILLEEGIDGVVFVPVDEPDEQRLARLGKHGIKIVVADRRVDHWPVVEAENVRGSYELTQYVLNLGYRRIAYIAGPPSVSTSRDRVQGFLKAMEDAGLQPIVMKYGDFTFEAGYTLAQQILSHGAVELVMCGNDLMAIGVLRAAMEMGMGVPQDLGLTGFDRIQFADLVHPPLTTVEVPAYEMGRAAAELLFSSSMASRTISVKIISGATCAPRG